MCMCMWGLRLTEDGKYYSRYSLYPYIHVALRIMALKGQLSYLALDSTWCDDTTAWVGPMGFCMCRCVSSAQVEEDYP